MCTHTHAHVERQHSVFPLAGFSLTLKQASLAGSQVRHQNRLPLLPSLLRFSHFFLSLCPREAEAKNPQTEIDKLLAVSSACSALPFSPFFCTFSILHLLLFFPFLYLSLCHAYFSAIFLWLFPFHLVEVNDSLCKPSFALLKIVSCGCFIGARSFTKVLRYL